MAIDVQTDAGSIGRDEPIFGEGFWKRKTPPPKCTLPTCSYGALSSDVRTRHIPGVESSILLTNELEKKKRVRDLGTLAQG